MIEVAHATGAACRGCRRAGCRRSRGTRSRARCASAARSPTGCAASRDGRSSRISSKPNKRAMPRAMSDVGREVGVDLHAEGEDAGPQDREGRILAARRRWLAITPTLSAITSFLKQAPQPSARRRRAAGRRSRCAAARPAAAGCRARSIGPATSCGKKADEQREVEQVAPGAHVAPVDVDRVAERPGTCRTRCRPAAPPSSSGGDTVSSPTVASTSRTLSTKKLKYLKHAEHAQVHAPGWRTR